MHQAVFGFNMAEDTIGFNMADGDLTVFSPFLLRRGQGVLLAEEKRDHPDRLLPLDQFRLDPERCGRRNPDERRLEKFLPRLCP
mgnify:CR=1 FL=1